MKLATFARAVGLACILALGAVKATADADPLEGGWSLDGAGSLLTFQSIKNTTVVESSSFAALEGGIDTDGLATISVYLESVDTKIDLRNVRMRFLFFETFLHPKATITAQIDTAALADLPQTRRKTIPLAYTLDLHGVSKEFQTDVVVTLISEDQVFVSTAAPISVAVADFGLIDGLKKLEEAAKLPIVPSATVTFDFLFQRDSGDDASEKTETAATSSHALESQGAFAPEECRNRLEALSEANEVSFASGSTRLQDKSAPVLDSLAEIIGRCPNLVVEVGGHTDSVGSDTANQRLSERRAASVEGYLVSQGITADRFRTVGYGESKPVASNDTDRGRWRNRRIEFTAIDE